MKIKSGLTLVCAFLVSSSAFAACPSESEVYEAAAKLLVKTSSQVTWRISDFSEHMGYSGTPISSNGQRSYLVQAVSDDLQQNVTGVVSCDAAAGKLVVGPYTWMSPQGMGTVGGVTIGSGHTGEGELKAPGNDSKVDCDASAAKGSVPTPAPQKSKAAQEWEGGVCQAK